MPSAVPVPCFDAPGPQIVVNARPHKLRGRRRFGPYLNPVLLAATNSSGAVTGKMISPQNIAVGVTTVGLVGQEGKVLHSTFWHSALLATLIGFLALAQAYILRGMVP
jgi:hypothetical protein